MTNHPGIFNALAAEFVGNDVKQRKQGGFQIHYITARTAMNRLDDVLGPENWWDDYVASENSVACRLTIRLPDGTTLTKCDAGGMAGMADAGDDDKSGYSDAFKRACVKFGVARYLYRDGVPTYPEPTAPPANLSPPSPAPTPSHPKPASPAPRKPDARTYWQMVVDATNRRNELRGESVSPHDTHWMLVVIASNKGLVSIEFPEYVDAPLQAMHDLHSTDPTWVIGPLMRLVSGELTPRKVDNLFRFEREDFPLDPGKVGWGEFVKYETSDCGRGFAGEAAEFVKERTNLLGTDTNWKDTLCRRKMLDALRDYVSAHPCSLLPEGA